ncbi:hypothetical protein, partial [Halorubrum yunnanense]
MEIGGPRFTLRSDSVNSLAPPDTLASVRGRRRFLINNGAVARADERPVGREVARARESLAASPP